MTTKLFPAWAYYGALALVVGLFASTLYPRVVHFDDAWLAEQAYSLRRDGYVHSELFRGLNGWEKQLFVFHKGYAYALALTMSGLGESLWAVKTTSLLFVGAGLLLLLRYFRGQAEARWLAAVLYLGCGAVVTFGFTGRPEALVMCCGLASYVVLARAPEALRPGWGAVVLAGALAGLAALAHLNGLIYLAAGALWLLNTPGGWRRALGFGLAGTVVTALYLADAAVAGQLPVLAQQFLHDPVNQANLSLAAKLGVMFEFPTMFFHSDAELAITLVLLLSMLLTAGHQPSRRGLSPALRYLLLLLGLFWLLTKSATVYYLVLFVPFFVIVGVEAALGATATLPVWRLRLLLLVLGLYPLASLARARYLWHENATYPQPEVENRRLAAHMPCHHRKVIAPIDFIFGEFDHYRIHSLTYYYFVSNDGQPDSRLPLATFFARAAADSVAYVVADYRTFNMVYHIPPDAPAQIGAYRRTYQTPWYGLYERQPPCPLPAAQKQGR